MEGREGSGPCFSVKRQHILHALLIGRGGVPVHDVQV